MSAWQHLGEGLLLGGGLGLIYGFLRPFRPRWLGDLLFIISLFWAWIYLGFGLCGGDLRMGYSLCLPIGTLLWLYSFGRFLQPVFSLFWNRIYRILGILFVSAKKVIKNWGIS